ncbi:MAG: ribonuclease H-like domain-containing protein [Clostridia bacterium]|nr:ribonuclease H-like domain-containing protein [Clostridia bacterium]
MALSLREKLKTAGAVQKKPSAPVSDGQCLIRTEERPAGEMGLPPVVSGQVLRLLQGQEYTDIRREDLLFLDTETTGLSGGAGTVAFLVGVGYFEGDKYRLEQFLMRDYNEEASVIARTAERMRDHPILCTFNGVTFDLPLLRSRAVMQRTRLPAEKGHIDLLHISRRVWRMRLKKCNLKNIEEQILGLTREDDLPGAMVPETYFRFLRTRDMSLLEGILEHNAQDIGSLPVLLDLLMKIHSDPLSLESSEDLYSMGRVHERRGMNEEARKCYRAAGQKGLAFLSRVRMAEIARREGKYTESAELYESALRKRQSAEIHIALSKIYEHRLRDLPMALEHASRAMMLTPPSDRAAEDALMKRMRRLRGKMDRTNGET